MTGEPRGAWSVRVRTEAWDGPGGRRLLLLASDAEDCLCLLLAHDPSTRIWSRQVGCFGPEALACAREDFEDALPRDVPRAPFLMAVGMLVPMAGQVARLFGMPWRSGWTGPRSERTDHEDPGDARTFAYLEGLGYREPKPTTGFVEAALAAGRLPPPGAAVGDAGDPATLRFGPGRPGDGRVAANAAASARLDAWGEQAARWLLPPDLGFVAPQTWTPEIHAFFTEAGTKGLYRRQAGALYPILAPALAGHAGLRALVDAGRPFEALACEVLDAAFVRGPGEGLTPARLRRLRGPVPAHPVSVAHMLRLAGRIPVERLGLVIGGRPESPMRHLDLLGLERWADENRLSLATLVRRHPEGRDALRKAARLATDLSRRMAETLAAPLLGGGMRPGLEPVTSRLLYEGLDLSAIAAMTARWHARLRSFEAALPEGRDLSTWPALFEPFVHEGVRITCLTLPSELRDEGWTGPDRNGMDGLSHCVGGFAMNCYRGASHVASVRTVRDGRTVRLSTVELSVGDRVGVVQHFGLGNAEPPEPARSAVSALVEALASGRVRMSSEAAAPRDGAGFRDGIAWDTPEARGRAWAAWLPFMPRRLAVMGPDGFKACLLAAMGGFADPA